MHAYHHMNEDQQDEIRVCAKPSEWRALAEVICDHCPPGLEVALFLKVMDQAGAFFEDAA